MIGTDGMVLLYEVRLLEAYLEWEATGEAEESVNLFAKPRLLRQNLCIQLL